MAALQARGPVAAATGSGATGTAVLASAAPALRSAGPLLPPQRNAIIDSYRHQRGSRTRRFRLVQSRDLPGARRRAGRLRAAAPRASWHWPKATPPWSGWTADRIRRPRRRSCAPRRTPSSPDADARRCRTRPSRTWRWRDCTCMRCRTSLRPCRSSPRPSGWAPRWAAARSSSRATPTACAPSGRPRGSRRRRVERCAEGEGALRAHSGFRPGGRST